jgi:hypothetical protein
MKGIVTENRDVLNKSLKSRAGTLTSSAGAWNNQILHELASNRGSPNGVLKMHSIQKKDER